MYKHRIAAAVLVGQFIDLEIICSFEGKGGEERIKEWLTQLSLSLYQPRVDDEDGEGQISQ